MSDLQGWVIDPLGALTPEAVGAEAERRSRVAYQAWVEACGRTGVSLSRSWEQLLTDEKSQWSAVYGVCVRADLDHDAGG